MLHYILQENDDSDCGIATKLGFQGLMMNLVSSSDADIREAALRGLLALAKGRKCCTCGSSIGKGDDKLRQILEDRIKAISLMSEEDRSAAEEERQLLDSLWITF